MIGQRSWAAKVGHKWPARCIYNQSWMLTRSSEQAWPTWENETFFHANSRTTHATGQLLKGAITLSSAPKSQHIILSTHYSFQLSFIWRCFPNYSRNRTMLLQVWKNSHTLRRILVQFLIRFSTDQSLLPNCITGHDWLINSNLTICSLN